MPRWRVRETPSNYKVNEHADVLDWCVIDEEDGDIHDFYSSKDEAEIGLVCLKQTLGLLEAAGMCIINSIYFFIHVRGCIMVYPDGTRRFVSDEWYD